MENYKNTSLWHKTLGIQGDQDVERLRVSYTIFREHIKGLLDEVRKDFPSLTDHSIEHVDNLWRIAGLIIGENYPINPLEGFILGCSFLVHDSILSYKAYGGKDVLRNEILWKDCYQDIVGTEYDTEEGKQKIDFKVIRQLHAKKCGEILFRRFKSMDEKDYFLLADDEMREHYGQLIGDIASSHHWEQERLNTLSSQVNGLSKFPGDWTINPRKLACILRCADAASIDSGRAPEYLFRLLRLNGVSRDHWIAQNRIGIALDKEDNTRLVLTSTHDFEEKDFAAWNVSYDAVKVIEEELNISQEILPENEQFQVKTIAGAKSRKNLASFIKTRGWLPSDENVHISDVARLIMMLGGKELYGKDDTLLIVLRELIQNARDAIRARRFLEGEHLFQGKITVKVSKLDDDVVLSVIDNGVGMSLETVIHSLLNFGNSFWHEDAANVEFPGLKSSGFKSVGQFGIGFFSAFMIAKSVEIETRKYTDGINDAHLVKFPTGLTLAPIFAEYTSESVSYSTIVRLKLDDEHKKWPTEYETKSHITNISNLKVPFSAMLSTLVAGLDVDVYYQEFDTDSICIHQRIDAPNFDKKLWLRTLSFADYQHDKDLDRYIEDNYNRLQYIYDDQNCLLGLAAIGTRFFRYADFMSGKTIGGLLTEIHSRSGEYWLGVIEYMPNGARRGCGNFRASPEVISRWVEEQVRGLSSKKMNVLIRYRLQLAMHFFKVDSSEIAVVFCKMRNRSDNFVFSLKEIVKELTKGKKLIFVDANYGYRNDNEGHGDAYVDCNIVVQMLNSNELLYNPLMNSGYLSYKLNSGVPVNDNGFIDCLYRTAVSMGYELKLSYRDNFVKNTLGYIDRALVIEVR